MVVARAKALSENKKQLTKFVLIGGLAVLTDLACYYLFLRLLPVMPSTARWTMRR